MLSWGYTSPERFVYECSAPEELIHFVRHLSLREALLSYRAPLVVMEVDSGLPDEEPLVSEERMDVEPNVKYLRISGRADREALRAVREDIRGDDDERFLGDSVFSPQVGGDLYAIEMVSAYKQDWSPVSGRWDYPLSPSKWILPSWVSFRGRRVGREDDRWNPSLDSRPILHFTPPPSTPQTYRFSPLEVR